jgi:predicted RNA binding protein YcfA (HicA-like mRNA interferase family)
VPKSKVIKVLEHFGFVIIREREHIAMSRTNADGTITPLTLPNHKKN